MTSDAALLRAARTDAHAFRELYDRYAERMYGFHLRRTRDAAAALDLTAETFAQAWISRARFRDEAGGSAGPWLFGIARNVLAQSVRQRQVEQAACTRLGILDRLERERTTAAPSDAWLDDRLDGALDELPEGQRDAVVLRVVDDLDYARVADRLGTTPGAARVRVTRGLEQLRQRLSKDERKAV